VKSWLRSILIFASAVLPVSAAQHQIAGPQQKKEKASSSRIYDDPEGYQLLSVVMENEARVQKLREVAIFRRSSERAHCNEIPEEFQVAAHDPAPGSRAGLQFKRKFSLNRPYRLTWDFTDFAISAVGFDSLRMLAVISVNYACGQMCSSGSTYLFRKTDQGWVQIGQVCRTLS
jgi:hypothetical protein